MLAPSTQDYLEQWIQTKCSAGASFTSLDLTNDAKRNGHLVRNRVVAEWMRSNVIRLAHAQGSMYNQTLIRVDSKSDGFTWAYLYHEYRTDPDTYLDRDQNPQSYPVDRRKLVSDTIAPPSQSDGTSVPTLNAALRSALFVSTNQPQATQSKGHAGWKAQRRDHRGRWI